MTELLERLQRSLCTIAAEGREHLRIGPFDAYVDRLRRPKYHSFALPEPGAADVELGAALPELRAAYAQRDRTARTEFMEVLVPGLEALLLADGWTCSERMPVMVCTPQTLTVPPPVAGLTIELLGGFTPEEKVVAFLETQRVAFEDDSPITGEEITRWRTRATTSSFAAGWIDGAVAGTAFASRPVDGVSEVAGVATRPEHRRRGVAGAVTAAAVQAAFAGGAELAWLTAAGESAEAIYARAGFAVQGMLLAYDAPA